MTWQPSLCDVEGFARFLTGKIGIFILSCFCFVFIPCFSDFLGRILIICSFHWTNIHQPNKANQVYYDDAIRHKPKYKTSQSKNQSKYHKHSLYIALGNLRSQCGECAVKNNILGTKPRDQTTIHVMHVNTTTYDAPTGTNRKV